MNTRPEREEQLMLQLLDAVEKGDNVSQRHLARRMGVALGLANSYLKRCIRKGLIKITEAPANRYLYYLTPKGFAEKSRLTAKYLAASLAFYREASESCARVLAACRANGWSKLVLCGVSDLAEIAALRALEMDSDILGTYDPYSALDLFAGKPVWHRFEDVAACDAYVLTDLSAPPLTYEKLNRLVDPKRIVVPDVLGIERRGEGQGRSEKHLPQEVGEARRGSKG